jgi:hypothetical protein
METNMVKWLCKVRANFQGQKIELSQCHSEGNLVGVVEASKGHAFTGDADGADLDSECVKTSFFGSG